jgi:hypothetical protein
MRRFLCCLAVLAAVMVLPASADVQNGQFLPLGGPDPGVYLTVPNSSGITIPYWTVTQGSVDWIGTYWQQPPTGGNSVDLDGYYAAGGISQHIVTTVGWTSLLSG